MAKIDPKYENPIDNFIVFKICEPLSDDLHRRNITPNMITTVGFASSLLGSYYLYNYKIWKFVLLYTFAYLCDCMDGYMARKYKLETKFGDYYDHVTDVVQMILVLYILWTRYDLLKYKKMVIISSMLLLMYMTTQGCQEILMGNNTSDILGITKNMCSDRIKDYIECIRHFGSGTVIFYVLFLSYYLWDRRQKS